MPVVLRREGLPAYYAGGISTESVVFIKRMGNDSLCWRKYWDFCLTNINSSYIKFLNMKTKISEENSF